MPNLNSSLFSFGNPLRAFDRWRHPYRHELSKEFNHKVLRIRWTERAQLALAKRNKPLIVEMQLYFSCLVKMRVLFHDEVDQPVITVNPLIAFVFRAVQSTACDPVEFARHYPVKRQFDSPAISKISPALLELDYRNDNWLGQFYLTDKQLD